MRIDKISVVLAVYNGQRYIKKLLTSILNQKNVHLHELIVVDDCSTDSSLDIVKEYQLCYSAINIICNEVNAGPISSFRRGIRVATGDFIALADQDDIWLDGKLSSSVELIKQTPIDKPSVVFTDLITINEYDSIIHKSFWNLYGIDPLKNNFYTILFGNVVTGCTTLFNKQMQAELIEMPLEVKMHDHWMALIAYSFGCFKASDEKTVLYRIHANSVTEKRQRKLKDIFTDFVKASLGYDSFYLKENFRQAELFRDKYNYLLSIEQNKQLNYFINLKNSWGFIKKLKAKSRFLK